MMTWQAFTAKFTYLFFCLNEIRDFFGVAILLFLFIDMSLRSEQQNTCKVLCLHSEHCLHSDWCGPRSELRTPFKLV